jgi:hypothetical protein
MLRTLIAPSATSCPAMVATIPLWGRQYCFSRGHWGAATPKFGLGELLELQVRPEFLKARLRKFCVL